MIRRIVRKDLTGKTFAELKVLHFAGLNKNSRAMWDCACSCGKNRVVLGKLLLNGSTRSCGHLRDDWRRGPRKPSDGVARVGRPRISRSPKPRPPQVCAPPDAEVYEVSNNLLTKTEAQSAMKTLRIQLADGKPRRASDILAFVEEHGLESGAAIRVARRTILRWTDEFGCVWLQLRPSTQVDSDGGIIQ